MDCYLVDILYPSEAFWGARIGNCDIKPTDGATYLRTGETFGIDYWVKLWKKDEKGNGIDGIWTQAWLMNTTPKGTVV